MAKRQTTVVTPIGFAVKVNGNGYAHIGGDDLLWLGGNVTVFYNRGAAEKAIASTLERSKAMGRNWSHLYGKGHCKIVLVNAVEAMTI